MKCCGWVPARPPLFTLEMSGMSPGLCSFFFLRNVDPAGMDFERRWTASQRRGQHVDDQQLVNGNPTRGPDDRYSAVVGYIRAG